MSLQAMSCWGRNVELRQSVLQSQRRRSLTLVHLYFILQHLFQRGEIPGDTPWFRCSFKTHGAVHGKRIRQRALNGGA